MKVRPLLVFFLALAVMPQVSQAEDSRVETARQLRDRIAEKNRQRAAADREDPFQAAVSEARERLESVDAQIEEKRRRSQSLAAPREKLIAREEELAVRTAKLQAGNRARIDAIYRSAKLGAGAAGWHPEPGKSARLSRYLAAVAAAQSKPLAFAEVEHGSAIASLDRARAEDAAIAAEIHVLETDRMEAVAGLERAELDARDRPLIAEVAGASATAEASATSEDEETVRGLELAMAAATPGDPGGGNAEGAAGSDDFRWPTATPPQGAAQPSELPAPKLPAGGAQAKSSDPIAEDPGDDGMPAELEDGPAVLAPSEPLASVSAAKPGAASVGSAGDEPAGGESAAGGSASVAGPDEGQPPAPRRGLLSRIFGGGDRESDEFAASRGKLTPPLPGKVVANYGQQHKSGATYRGVILRSSSSAPVRAVAGGSVSFAGVVPGLGNAVIVSHGNRYHTVYARLGSVRVKQGEHIEPGTEVGELPVDDADMHFELRDKGKAIDPLPWLKGGQTPP